MKFCFLGFLLGSSGYVHGMADSMPTPNVERFEVAQLHDRACAAKFDGEV